MLQKKFKTLCQNFSKDKKLTTQLWEEIALRHSEISRHYHTLTHLEHIYKELQEIDLTHLLAFATFYHDIVYDAQRNDNEKQSALLAQERLAQLNVPIGLNEKVFQLIIETKRHKASSKENELFLDADLSILGSSEKSYKLYAKNVRKEYSIYDDKTYFIGRKKVLKMFLEKNTIYESKHFYDKYEKQARVNMLIEYNSLKKNLL
jgi:predicted metal-dependent HD superfamily phosphohydrolase